MRSLNAADVRALVASGCQEPGCTHHGDVLVLNGRCHPGSDVRVVALATGGLRVECARCSAPIVALELAEPLRESDA